MAEVRQPPPGFHIGASYYPEQWDPVLWPEHLRTAADLGLTTIRVLEFAWTRLEPAPGQFNFEWMDRFFDVCGDHGLNLVVGTPTAAPPVWLTSTYADVLPVGADGLVRQAGGRRHYCLHSENLRAAVRRIVSELAAHLAERPELIAWQIDNEVAAYRSSFCYCDRCVVAFRTWLQARYEDVAQLNQAWGTVAWSAEVGGWQEVDIPRLALSGSSASNKAVLLDFWRFSSDALADFISEQASLLRSHTSELPITTNWTSTRKATYDWADIAHPLSFTSWDNYETDPLHAAFNHDLVRCARPGHSPFWIMEQRCAPPDNTEHVPLIPDGEITAASLHDIACGADAIIYFRLEQALLGAENQHGAILDRHGGTNTRIHRELSETVPRLRRIGDAVAGSRVHARVAIIVDPESSAVVSSPLPHSVKGRTRLIDHLEHLVLPWHQGLTTLGVDVDVVPPDANLHRYDLVVLAGLYLVSAPTVDRLTDFVRRGGRLIATPYTAVADQHANQIGDLLPAGLHHLFGARIAEQDFRPAGETVRLDGMDGHDLTGQLCCDLIEADGAEVRHRFSEGWYAGTAAITTHRFGKGHALLVGTVLDPASTRTLLSEQLAACGLDHYDLPPGVMLRRRHHDDTEFLFVINTAADPCTIADTGSWTDVDHQTPVSGDLDLSPRSGVVLKRRRLR